MGIFAIDIFLLDFPFKGRKRTCKVCLRFQRCHINFSGVIDTAEIVSTVSMTPRKLFQRCQWHRGNHFSSVNDTAEIVSAVSMTSMKFGKKKFCSWCPYEFFHSAITVISAVSMTLLKSFQRCQWHCGNCFSVVNDTAELVSGVSLTPLKFEYNWFSQQIWSHMRNGFRPWIRFDEKNRGSKISCNYSFKTIGEE
jgi:hypothetical protein